MRRLLDFSALFEMHFLVLHYSFTVAHCFGKLAVVLQVRQVN